MTANIEEFFYIENDTVILKSQGSFPERTIGTVKSSEEETIQYFQERYEKLQEKVAEVSSLIEEQDNKGSFLQKVINLREELTTYDGIGDFVTLEDRLKNLQLMLEDYIQQNRKRNLEVKNTLIAEAKSYAANPNWKEATEQLKELRQRWIKIGAVDQEHSEVIETGFQEVYDDFYSRKKVFHEARIAMMNSRIAQYSALISKAEKLNQDDKLSEEEWLKQSEKLIADWKALESIPKDKYDELLRSFKKLTSNKGKKASKKGVTKQSKAGEEDKKQLIAQLKVAVELPVSQAIQEAKKIQAAWKAAAHISLPKSFNEDFYQMMDYIFEKNFLESLYAKKAKGDPESKEALKSKMNLLRDLISRDQKELLIFEENMGMFNLESSKIDKMVGFKLEKQKRKVTVKQQILAELQEKYKKLNN